MSFETLMNLTITVEDANDNPPYFLQNQYQPASVPEDAGKVGKRSYIVEESWKKLKGRVFLVDGYISAPVFTALVKARIKS